MLCFISFKIIIKTLNLDDKSSKLPLQRCRNLPIDGKMDEVIFSWISCKTWWYESNWNDVARQNKTYSRFSGKYDLLTSEGRLKINSFVMHDNFALLYYDMACKEGTYLIGSFSA